MKTILHFISNPLTYLLAMALTLGACGLNEDETTKPVVIGEGKGITAVRSIENFSAIDLETDADIFVQTGEVAKIEVEAQKNLQPYILTYVTGNKLVIKTSGHLQPTEKIKVFVTVPALTKVEVTGAGRVIGSNTIVTEELSTKVEGSGRIDLAVNAKVVKTNLSGSGSIYLEGNTSVYKATISGSGSVDTQKLITKKSA